MKTRKTTPKSVTAPKQITLKGKAKLLSSKVAFKGDFFSVYRDHVVEPGGVKGYRDIIRHNGSVVVLAIDDSKSKKDPSVVLVRQYRHAAGQFLVELPAGKLDKGETPLAGAKREMIEETGFRAKKWKKLVRYYPSPGFVGEWMEIYLASGITAGTATPEEDEKIEVTLVPLSKIKADIVAGRIRDGKTIIGILMLSTQL